MDEQLWRYMWRSQRDLLVAVLIALPVAVSASTEAERVAVEAFTSARFEQVTRLADLPRAVRQGLGAPIADVDGEWNAGCLQDDLPGRRLIFAGRSAELWFVFFEQGGIVRQQRLITLRRQLTGSFVNEGEWEIEGAPPTIETLQVQVAAMVDGVPAAR